MLNAFNDDVKKEPDYENEYLSRLCNCLRYKKYKKNMRELSFAKPSKFYFKIKEATKKKDFIFLNILKKEIMIVLFSL